jgi:hypothetical protein
VLLTLSDIASPTTTDAWAAGTLFAEAKCTADAAPIIRRVIQWEATCKAGRGVPGISVYLSLYNERVVENWQLT